MRRPEERLQSTSAWKYRFVLLLISGVLLLAAPLPPLDMGRLGSWVIDAFGRLQPRAAAALQTMPVEDHFLHMPYFAQSDTMASTLTLNNNQSEKMIATVTLFNSEGEALTLSPMTLEPQLPMRFPIDHLTEGAGERFSSGNVQVFFHGQSMGGHSAGHADLGRTPPCTGVRGDGDDGVFLEQA